MRVRLVLAIAIAAALLLVACEDAAEPDSEAGSEGSEAVVVVEDAWVRATPDGATTTGAFMVLTNEGDVDDALVSVSVSDKTASEVQIHETVTGDMDMESEPTDEGGESGESGGMEGMAQIREVGILDIPAGESVELAPGSYHLMFLDAAALDEGDTVKIRLTFKESGDQEVEAEVRPL